jgi:hypothetical protein
VASAEVLQEGVPGDHDLCCSIGLESTHRSQPALELAVIGLDRIIRILLDVMPRRGQHLIENGGIDRRGVGDDLARGGRGVPAGGDSSTSINDLAVLVDRPVDVASDPVDLDVHLPSLIAQGGEPGPDRDVALVQQTLLELV